jgi:hypothetical protein
MLFKKCMMRVFSGNSSCALVWRSTFSMTIVKRLISDTKIINSERWTENTFQEVNPSNIYIHVYYWQCTTNPCNMSETSISKWRCGCVRHNSVLWNGVRLCYICNEKPYTDRTKSSLCFIPSSDFIIGDNCKSGHYLML